MFLWFEDLSGCNIYFSVNNPQYSSFAIFSLGLLIPHSYLSF